MEVGDGGAKLRDAEEAGALQAATSQFGEEAFDLIEPGAVGGDKVKVPTRVAGEPAHDRVGFAGGVVVELGAVAGLAGSKVVSPPRERPKAASPLFLGAPAAC